MLNGPEGGTIPVVTNSGHGFLSKEAQSHVEQLNSTLKGWIKDFHILPNRGFLHCIAELRASIH